MHAFQLEQKIARMFSILIRGFKNFKIYFWWNRIKTFREISAFDSSLYRP